MKNLLAGTISEPHNDADRFAYEAENSSDLESIKSLTKSNCFHIIVKEKEDKLQE